MISHPITITDEYLAAILAELKRMREELAALHALQQVEPADDGTVELREPAKMALRKRR